MKITHDFIFNPFIQDEDVFKTCLEFWSHFTKELYNAEAAFKTTAYSTYGGSAGGAGSAFGGVQGSSLRGGKQALYEGILHNLRILMIDNMAKPEVRKYGFSPFDFPVDAIFFILSFFIYFALLLFFFYLATYFSYRFCVYQEVIIVEDDNGEIVREQTKDTEVIAQYKTMRETIVYLTNLNYEDTEAIMLEKLDLQVNEMQINWLCVDEVSFSCLRVFLSCL